MVRLPEKTVERLSRCRRVLLDQYYEEKDFIFSHEIASLLHVSPVQVRRDLMLMGYTGSPSKGYKISKLIKTIENKVDGKEVINAAVVGMGKLGHALVRYLKDRRERLVINAIFDNDPNLINNIFADIKCYHIDEIPRLISELNISIAILTVPATAAADVKNLLVESGIKGIINYTPTPLKVPDNVFLDEYDIVTSLEKVAYFIKQNKK